MSCGAKIPGRQVAVATEFCMVAPNISGRSVWNFISHSDAYM